jgi:hypothetical protein
MTKKHVQYVTHTKDFCPQKKGAKVVQISREKTYEITIFRQ